MLPIDPCGSQDVPVNTFQCRSNFHEVAKCKVERGLWEEK